MDTFTLRKLGFTSTKGFLTVSLIVSVIGLKSCAIESITEFKCSECYTEEPSHSWVDLKVTIDVENPEVPITIYVGPPENEVIYSYELANETPYKVQVKNETAYTVKAEYRVDGRSRIVFNQIKTKMYYDYESCSEPCYWVSDKTVNLRIKN
jgi:RNA polymerase subunit RPABC4/transcription elongation factor Spt4